MWIVMLVRLFFCGLPFFPILSALNYISPRYGKACIASKQIHTIFRHRRF